LRIRHAIRAIPLLMAIGPLLAPAGQLPAYCGAVGAKSYTPPAVTVPAVVLNRGTVITVTNATVAINGDTSSVKALIANPGPDGISLPEAITATNNNPGTWVIQFAPALKGSIIDVDPAPSIGFLGLPGLTGGNVTINGDIDDDGQPDITLTSMSGNLTVYVMSGGNTINRLALQGCGMSGCVQLRNPSASGGFGPGPVATGTTFSNTTISNLVMTNIPTQGVAICPNCGPTVTSPTGNVWDHVLITGNTITGSASGPNNAIDVQIAWGDTLQHTIIANNNLVLLAQGALGISLGTGGGLGPPDQGSDIVLDTLVINNTITAPIGIVFRGGTAVGSLYDGAQVIGNQISTTGGAGITFFPADVESGLVGTLVQRFNNNIITNIAILANSIEGPGAGIQIQAGQNAAANNAISNVSIMGNTLLNTVTGSANGPTTGMFLFGGRSDYSAFVATGNSLSNVLIQANTIQSLIPPGNINFGGGDPQYAIVSAGISAFGGIGAQGNSINGISIAHNDVNTPSVGIAITGGWGGGSPTGGAPTFSADNNVVAGAQIFCNQVDQIPTQGVTPASGIEGINLVAGLAEASGNQVQQAYIVDNLVAGVLGGASTFGYLGSGGSGNTMSTSASPTPAISLVANAEGESPVIAPNTWIEIKGVNLAPLQDALNVRTWTPADFLNNQMPVELDGVSATVNGKSAFVYYVSPSQVNVLTPPDAMSGGVQVVVTSNGSVSASFTAQAQAASPSFFAINGGPYVLAQHGADNSLLGPASMSVPGYTFTPAKPGETVVLYGNGFGAISPTVVSGASSQTGTLNPLPTVTIGGITATVNFAGINGPPGLFQFDVVVPSTLANGDQPITATYNGFTKQAGTLITVQN